MARKKRASMREGPLADLFRSTDEAAADDEVKVTAAKANGKADVAVAEAPAEDEIKVERVRPEAEEAEVLAEEQPEPEAEAADVAEAEAEPKIVEAPPLEERRIVRGGPLSDEQLLNPKRDPAIEEIEERDAHKLHRPQVTEEPAPRIEHEGLRRLMGNDVPDIGPAFGREEPSAARASVVPRTHQAVLRVVGVGGAGVNAVNRMVEAQVPGVEFVAINTDLQSLQNSNADSTLHIGGELTRGLGSGSDPRVGYRAAWEEQDKIKGLLAGSDMVFIAAGAGGGTGTGAAPVVAKLARDVGALTVAAITKPFGFEGARRMAQAEEGIAALSAEVDTLIVVPNERLLEILERRTSITDAFRVADDVLRQAVQGISDLVALPGLINLDFADVRTTMLESGDAILGIGMGVGEHRAMLAAEKAVSSPLLDTSVEGAQSLLLSITGGSDLSLIEASEAARIVQEAAHPEANIIFGASIDEDLDEQVWVTVIATRFESPFHSRPRRERRSDPRDPRHRDEDRYGDPAADWRGGHSRGVTADEIYGDGTSPSRDTTRRPAMPGGGDGRVLHVPEFIPGH
ncbi:MAG: cell division protein FtsZ [Solirubrobacterales bacterium]